MAKKTNAMRLLDRAKIQYRILQYIVNEEQLDAVHVAEQVGMPANKVFKTLVTKGDKTGVLLACIPGDADLDFKLLAKASGNKSVSMVALKEVLPLTGYIRGGVSPLGGKKDYPLYLDNQAKLHEEISISAGLRGFQIVLAPNDLVQAVGQGVFSDIVVSN